MSKIRNQLSKTKPVKDSKFVYSPKTRIGLFVGWMVLKLEYYTKEQLDQFEIIKDVKFAR